MVVNNLGLETEDNPEVISTTIAKSEHAKDYFIKTDYIRGVRDRHVNVEHRRADRDVDSVWAAVRSIQPLLPGL